MSTLRSLRLKPDAERRLRLGMQMQLRLLNQRQRALLGKEALDDDRNDLSRAVADVAEIDLIAV